MIVRNTDRNFVINESFALALIEYLSKRPYIEVYRLIEGLNKLIPIVEETKDATSIRPECTR